MAKVGNNVLIYQDGKVIAGTKSNDAQSDADLIEKSSPNSGAWREYVAGRNSWTMNTNYLVLADNGVRDLLKVGTEYTLTFKERGRADTDGVTGKALLKTCKITATMGNLVQGTFQFVGNGELK